MDRCVTNVKVGECLTPEHRQLLGKGSSFKTLIFIEGFFSLVHASSNRSLLISSNVLDPSPDLSLIHIHMILFKYMILNCTFHVMIFCISKCNGPSIKDVDVVQRLLHPVVSSRLFHPPVENTITQTPYHLLSIKMG